MNELRHRCGRREPYDPSFTSPLRPPFGDGGVENPDSWRTDGTCDYCGSASGDAFIAFVEAGGEVGPTDKSYKAYLKGNDKVRAPSIKFYFQHLSADQRTRFITLLNERKVNVGYPGHFYVLPYFAVIAKDNKAE